MGKFNHKILITFFSFLCVIVILYYRRSNPRDFVDMWVGKTMILPQANYMGTEYEKKYLYNAKYKLLVYLDSTGCLSCKLQLSEWKKYISLLKQNGVSVLFYFGNVDKNQAISLFKNENFNYPYFLDKNDSINLLNKIPDDNVYRTFLLNRSNKVIAIGNPIINPNIKKLYWGIITKGHGEKKQNTNFSISPTKINLGQIALGKIVSKNILIKNTGKNNLVIDDIGVSCDCIKLSISKHVIKGGQSANLKVIYHATKEVDFFETIHIASNAKPNLPKIEVIGRVI